MGLAYGLLFAVVLSIIGVSLFVTVRDTVTETVTESLADIAAIAAHHVNRSTLSRLELLQRSLRIAERWAEDLRPLVDGVAPLDHFSEYVVFPDWTNVVNLVELRPGVAPLEALNELARETEADVALLQRTDTGLIVLASTGPPDGQRARGYIYPNDAAVTALVDRGGGWSGREYFDETWYLSGYQPIPGGDGLFVRVAVEQVQMNLLTEDLADVRIGEGSGFVYMLDLSVTIIYHPDRTREGQNLSVEPWAREIAFGRSGTISYRDSISYFAAYEFVPTMNWVVVVATPADQALAQIDRLTVVFAAMFSVAVLLALGISMFLAGQVSRPIVAVARRFKQIADGEGNTISVTPPARGSNEVRALVRDFNRYVDRTRELNELERREIALELRQQQMHALQAQINPHFLYNTLETIRFLIEMGDSRAVHTIQTLSDLFRISLAKPQSFAPLSEEVTHAQLYFEIQRIRYPSTLSLAVDVPPDLESVPVINFLLQPLVENAVLHGIVPASRPGVVSIRASREGGTLLLEVSDTGIGIPADDLERLFTRRESRSAGRNGIGLANVKERIRLHYGPDFGVELISTVGAGTTVRVTMPLRSAVSVSQPLRSN